MLVLLGISLVLSAFFSGSEAALLSVQRLRIRHLANVGVAGAARVVRLVERPEKLLPPILLGNNLVNTAAAALATGVAFEIFEDESRAMLVATASVTLLLLVFGETIPKTIATRHSERFSIIIALPVQGLHWVFRPFSILLEWVSGAVAGLFGGGRSTSMQVTEEEIRMMVSLGSQMGAVETAEADMMRRVLDFGDRMVREVMTPRTEIVWVSMNTSLRAFLSIYDEHYHTRFPVYDGDVDNVVGLLSVKDVLRAQSKGAVAAESSVTTAMRHVYYAPETKPVLELFDNMRSEGHQMAMVVDEFGGISGLVTLKRLIEGVVGPVGEEGAAPPDEVLVVGEDTFELEADLHVIEANERMGLDLPEGEYDTLAGFLLEHLGRLPEQGEHISIGNVQFRVLEMKGLKIERVLVTRVRPAEA